METKKWSTKRKVLVSILVILCAAIIAGVLYMFFKPDPLPQVSAAKVTRGSITQTLDMSGKVSSSQKGNFIPIDGTKVLTVNVKVGEYVKKGDVLATFDTSSLNSVLADKQQAYLTAVENYKNAKNTAVTSSAQLKEINARLAEIDKELEKQEKEQNKNNGSDKNNQDKTDSEASNKFWELISKALGMEDINAALKKLDELLNSGNSNLFGSGVSALQMEKMQLELKKVTLEAQSGGITQSTYKTIMEATKKELDSLTASLASLKKGWIAETDGVVREINIVAGETYHTPKGDASASLDDIDISSLLSSVTSDTKDFSGIISQLFPGTPGGMVIEYYPLSATFSVSGKDIYKIKLDQPVEVTGATGKKFSGYVSFISPIASESGTMSITSILGSASGGSEVEAKAMIEQPDKSIIIGLSVDMSIDVETQKNATLIPVESIQYEDGKSYVYLYDADSRTVKKTEVTTGLFDGERYQILSGCSAGDKIVKIPSEKIEDGQKIYAK